MPRPGYLTLAVDFHGVICAHPEGSRGLTEPGWPEVPGALAWLREVSAKYDIYLVSARFARPGPEGQAAMAAARRWLLARGVPSCWMSPMERSPRLMLSGSKPACHLWIDDRAYCFRGAFPAVAEIAAFRPWNRRDEDRAEAEAEGIEDFGGRPSLPDQLR